MGCVKERSLYADTAMFKVRPMAKFHTAIGGQGAGPRYIGDGDPIGFLESKDAVDSLAGCHGVRHGILPWSNETSIARSRRFVEGDLRALI